MKSVDRQTVDLGGYPDLVVIYLGMRVKSLRGLRTLLRFGPMINRAIAAKPDGLLLHENFFFSLLPPHAGMRQYWRDFDSLERFARTMPHQGWWKDYLRDTEGTGFWHETYFVRGGFEAVYDDLPEPMGFGKFAPRFSARGAMFSARQRLKLKGEAATGQAFSERELYK